VGLVPQGEVIPPHWLVVSLRKLESQQTQAKGLFKNCYNFQGSKGNKSKEMCLCLQKGRKERKAIELPHFFIKRCLPL
jgi:hypothetical protein